MNSYELSRAWFDFSFDNPHKIKPHHAAIYFFAIEHCNRLGWKKIFGFPTSMVLEAIGMKSYGSYKKYLEELVDFGFIKIHEYSKNQYSANIIELTFKVKASDKALDKAFVKHATKQSESTSQSTVSIDKQITNKQINNKPITNKKVYSNEVHDTFDFCLTCFDEELKPQTDKQINSWLDTIEKLNRIDKLDFSIIKTVVKKTRSDSFWSQNFQSITKLRKTNKDGIKYFTAFYNKFKDNYELLDTSEIRRLYPDL